MSDNSNIKNKYEYEFCEGLNYFPDSYKELKKILNNISDKWDSQIACVFFGNKKVAMTDYDSFDDKDSIIEYYEDDPIDEELRETALKNGVQLAFDNSGSFFWFYPKYRYNVDILLKHYNGEKKFPSKYYNLIQGLLLGYSETSLILYIIYNKILLPAEGNDHGEKFLENLYKKELNGKLRKKIEKDIEFSKLWIRKQKK